MRALVAAALLLAAGCRHTDVLLLLHVDARADDVVQLRIAVANGARSATLVTPSAAGGPLSFPTSVELSLPDDTQGSVAVVVSAIDAAGATRSTGSGQVDIDGNGNYDLHVDLDAAGAGDMGTDLMPACPVQAGTNLLPEQSASFDSGSGSWSLKTGAWQAAPTGCVASAVRFCPATGATYEWASFFVEPVLPNARYRFRIWVRTGEVPAHAVSAELMALTADSIADSSKSVPAGAVPGWQPLETSLLTPAAGAGVVQLMARVTADWNGEPLGCVDLDQAALTVE